MQKIKNLEDRDRIENSRALVGVYVDRAYSHEKIKWITKAREGFDGHAKDAWHLLIPIKDGYAIGETINPTDYGVELANEIIKKLKIKPEELPCIVFRSEGENFFFLKLGGKTKEKFLNEISEIADLAVECQKKSNLDGARFRVYVNKKVALRLHQKRLLSVVSGAVSVIARFMGVGVDIKDLA